MSNFTLEPNMNLILPTPGVEFGPQYASDQNQDMLIIGSHNHGPGSGVPVTPTGLNINTNLNFLNNSPFNVYSVIFSAPASNSALTNVYTNTQSGGGIIDLFFNDGAGNVIALTKAGAVNATIASIPGESYSAGTFTWVQGNGSTTPANFDIGSITIRPNTAGTTNGVVVGPPSGISSQYNLQLPTLPAQTNVVTLDPSGNMASITYDQVGQNMSSVGANAIANSRTRTVAQTVGIGGIAISPSCGNFGIPSASVSTVTNLTITITTSGRPVMLMLQSDASNPGAFVQSGVELNNSASAPVRAEAFIFNGTTIIGTTIFENTGSAGFISWPPSVLTCVDTTVSGVPGTYTYTIQGATQTNAGMSFLYLVLVAYEL